MNLSKLPLFCSESPHFCPFQPDHAIPLCTETQDLWSITDKSPNHSFCLIIRCIENHQAFPFIHRVYDYFSFPKKLYHFLYIGDLPLFNSSSSRYHIFKNFTIFITIIQRVKCRLFSQIRVDPYDGVTFLVMGLDRKYFLLSKLRMYFCKLIYL